LYYSLKILAQRPLLRNIKRKTKADSGSFDWGVTTNQAYLPVDNHSYFENDLSLVDWLRQWVKQKKNVMRLVFLGKMIFSGEEALKTCRVLSGGEKVRCMMSRMMMERANILMIDEPTNHLDLESIQAFNNSLKNFKGSVILLPMIMSLLKL
jgi:ATPase subunit of ABC transporter with duplicated ATPase domains